MADEGHSLIPLPAWARVVRQLQAPVRVYQEQLLRLYEPLQRYQRQLQGAYAPMFRYWERFVYWERSFGLGFEAGGLVADEFDAAQWPDEHNRAWWAPPIVVSSHPRNGERGGTQRRLVPRASAGSVAPVEAREAHEGDRPAGAAADAEGRMGPDELRRQLARVEARLRQMGDLEQEVEDLLVSIRAELARQPGTTRASTRA